MTQPHVSEPELVVLHAIRCVGFAGEARIAIAAGVETAGALATLRNLADDGLVSHHEGPFGGWTLTDAGRAADIEWVAAEVATTGARDQLMEDYVDFLDLNPKLLAVCSAWQVREVGGAHLANDHRDTDYDFEVLDRLANVHRSVQPILDSLSNVLTRFSTYRRRLRNAMQRVDAGDHEYFTDGLESYHTVWFQLHEDLLSTLGKDRWSEQ